MEQKALTGEDRCDRCGAQAVARTMHEKIRKDQDSDTLVWCSHHFYEHGDALSDSLVFFTSVYDEPTKEPVRT